MSSGRVDGGARGAGASGYVPLLGVPAHASAVDVESGAIAGRTTSGEEITQAWLLADGKSELGIEGTAACYGITPAKLLAGAYSIVKTLLVKAPRNGAIALSAGNTVAMIRTTCSLLLERAGVHELPERRTESGIDIFYNTAMVVATLLVLKDMAALYKQSSPDAPDSLAAKYDSGEIDWKKYITDSYNTSPRMCSAVTNTTAATIKVGSSAIFSVREWLLRTLGRENIMLGAGAIGAETSAANGSLPMLGFTTNTVAAGALLPPTGALLDPRSRECKELVAVVLDAMKKDPSILDKFYQEIQQRVQQPALS